MSHTLARKLSSPVEVAAKRRVQRREMIMPVAQMTVGEIASHVPSSLRVFERFQIDYSCGGSKTLVRACRDSGVAADQVLSEIEQACSAATEDQGVDWTEVPTSELIDHIVRQHHWYTWAELPRIEQLIGKLLQSCHPEYPEPLLLLSGVFRGLRGELEHHMTHEQTHVFPAIVEIEKTAALGNPPASESLRLLNHAIGALLHEHELSGQALKEMRQFAREFQGSKNSRGAYALLLDELGRFEEDVHIHIHLESNILYPRTRELLAKLA
jgi:regulator of cell morphogenesis and NO signaling